MKSGYVKTYRKILISDIWKMPPLYERVFKYLNLKAKYKIEEFPTRRKFNIYLLPGQFITSMDGIAEGVSWYEWGVEKKPNKKTIKDILEWLEGNSMVTVVSNAHGTFIEVVNWVYYHGFENEKVTSSNGTEVTQEKRLLDTIKEVKEVKELKNLKDLINTQLREKTKKEIKIFLFDSNEYKLAEFFKSEIRKNVPDFETNLQVWSKTFDFIVRVDKKDPKEIAGLIRWCQGDSFEMSNVMSPSSLRRRYPALILKMKGSNKKKGADWDA